jgi:hypothetical protein
VNLAVAWESYFARYDPLWAVVAPALGWVALLTLCLLAGWEFCLRLRLTRWTAPHFLWLAMCLLPLGTGALALLNAAPRIVPLETRARWFWPLALLIVAAPAILALRQPRRASRILRSGLLYSWPVLLLILLATVRGSLLFAHGDYADGPFAAALPSSPNQPRVVWIIFDELSQTVAFGNRPPGLSLPNLDRLREESFYATAAESPTGFTKTSLPSLIVGQKVLDAAPDGPGDLRLKLESSAPTVRWSSLPNVFDAARDLGFNTAVVGWYHPYGRVLRRSLTECYWTSGWQDPSIADDLQEESFAGSMGSRLHKQMLTLPMARRLPGGIRENFFRREKLTKFAYLDARSREVAADPKIGLALIHLPVPHPPAIYDRARGVLTVEVRSYADDVALADRELGLLRQAIGTAGLEDRTAILVSADHGWRPSLWRGPASDWTPEDEAASRQDTSGVPFLLKLPGQKAGSVYSQRFNTVLTRRVLTAILGGQLTDPAAVARMIESAGGN